LLKHFAAIARFAADLDVLLSLEQTTKPLAHDPMVVGYKYGNHLNRVTAAWCRDQLLFWASA
jgi:hypothetical protein